MVQNLLACLDELEAAFNEGRVSHNLRNHRSAEAAKILVHRSEEYEDQGNYYGSVLMYALLFPAKFQIQHRFSLLDALNGAGDRKEVLEHVGMVSQKSGKAQHNYRVNLLEALLGELGLYAKHTQKLWILLHCRALLFPMDWYTPFLELTHLMIHCDWAASDMEDAFITAECCAAHGLNLDAYFVNVVNIQRYVRAGGIIEDYWKLQKIACCSAPAARKLWAIMENLRSGNTSSPSTSSSSSPTTSPPTTPQPNDSRALRICRQINLPEDHYLQYVNVLAANQSPLECYGTIMRLTGCSKNAAKRLWCAVELLVSSSD